MIKTAAKAAKGISLRRPDTKATHNINKAPCVMVAILIHPPAFRFSEDCYDN